MKIAKLSLAALMALGVTAFADVTNVKFGGDAKLYYSTDDSGKYDLFDKKNSMGQAALDLSATADLANGVKGKVAITTLSTLGLENNLVGNIWAGSDNSASGGNILDTQWWASEAWLAKTFGKTTFKVGRQKLDTPLAFTEKWNIAENSFDAAVVLNQDLPKTTLVAAWVGRGNGAGGGGVVNIATSTNDSANNDPFRTYGSAINPDLASGAYAFGAITTAIPMTTFQAWYYDVVDIAHAYWLQADVSLEDQLKGLTVGLQYADVDPTDQLDEAVLGKNNGSLDDSSVWAAKIGYAMDNGLKLAVAYSSTDEDGAVEVANTATGLNRSQSKLYTEAFWNYGYVSKPSVDAWKVSAEYSLKDIADFGAYYTSADQDTGKYVTSTDVADMDEFALTASKSFGNLNTTLAYIYTDADDQNVDANGNSDSYNTVQVYLTYNF